MQHWALANVQHDDDDVENDYDDYDDDDDFAFTS